MHEKTAGRSLATSSRGVKWLDNFSKEDRPHAELLLHSVSVVSETLFRAELKSHIVKASGRWRSSKVVAYPVSSVPAGRAFTSLDDIEASGSELVVANVLNKLPQKCHLLEARSTADLLEKRIDVIYLVADNSGSGSEVRKYIDHLYSNKSIRSWHSSGHLRFEVLIYSCSPLAYGALKRDSRIHRLDVLHATRTMNSASWSGEQRANVEDVCRRYAADESAALGYGGSSGLVVFGHSFPNTVPAILYQRRGPRSLPKWKPLLPFDRGFGLDSADAIRVAGYAAESSLEPVLARMALLGESRAIQKLEQIALRRKLPNKSQKPLLALLIAFRLGVNSDFELMRTLNISRDRLEAVEDAARHLGLVTRERSILPAGRSFVRRVGRRQPHVREEVGAKVAGYYYPRQLR